MSLYFHNVFLYVLIAFFLLSFSYRETLLYVSCIAAAFIIENYIVDLMPCGIVDFKDNDHYIVDKLFYKVALYSEEDLNNGDIVICSSFKRCTEIYLLKKNIIFSGNEYYSDQTFVLRSFIDSLIKGFSEEIMIPLRKILYNQNIEDESLGFNIGYGLYSYYFLRYLLRKNRYCCIGAMIMISLLFSFETKFFLLIIDILMYRKNRKDVLSFKLIFLCIYNFKLFYNYSLLLPLLFSFIGIIKKRYDFRIYLLLIESLFFKQIDLFETLFFNSLIRIKVFFYVSSLILLVIPSTVKIYLFLLKIYSFINETAFQIRGSISLLSIMFFLVIDRNIKLNSYLQMVLLCLLIISPVNQPLMNVCFIDVGQGDATVIRYPLTRSCVLIDTGSSYNYHKLRKTLFAKGIYRIDRLIISHDDEDHNGNIENLKKDFWIGEIIEEGKDFTLHDINYRYLYLGDHENDNDNSLVYLVKIDGFAFLFTGDLSKKVENMIYEEYGPLKIDFLKVSHHGSYTGTSPYLIGNILPQYAIISTNGKYDHPSKETLATLDDYMSTYFITKEVGNIDVYFSYLFDFIRTGHNDFVIISKK